MIEYLIVAIVIIVVLLYIIYNLSQKLNTINTNNDEAAIAAVTKAENSYYNVSDFASYNTYLADYDMAQTLLKGLARPWSSAVTIAAFGLGSTPHSKYHDYIGILRQLLFMIPKLSNPNVTDAEKNETAGILVDFITCRYDIADDNILVHIYNIMDDPYKYDSIKSSIPQDVIDMAATRLLADLEKSRNIDPSDVYNTYLTIMKHRSSKLARAFDLKGLDVKLNSIAPMPKN